MQSTPGGSCADGSHIATNNNYAVGQGQRHIAVHGITPPSPCRQQRRPSLEPNCGCSIRPRPTTVRIRRRPIPCSTFPQRPPPSTPLVLRATLQASASTAISGPGQSTGSRVVSAADNNTTVAITLNAAAVAALNAAIGSTISLGGALTTLAGTATQEIFGSQAALPGRSSSFCRPCLTPTGTRSAYRSQRTLCGWRQAHRATAPANRSTRSTRRSNCTTAPVRRCSPAAWPGRMVATNPS